MVARRPACLVRIHSKRRRHGPLPGSRWTAVTSDTLLLSPQHKSPAGWSPDGRVLLYVTADPDTNLDIWALPIGSGEKPFPVVRSPYEDINPQFGPDGTWIVYQSSVSNRYEVYIRPFPGPGAPVLISTDGATQPRLRRDGKELFYVALDHWM